MFILQPLQKIACKFIKTMYRVFHINRHAEKGHCSASGIHGGYCSMALESKLAPILVLKMPDA